MLHAAVICFRYCVIQSEICLRIVRILGAKAHILMKADEDVPGFVCLTEAKENDNIFPPM
jgi:hypothetical protein